MRVSVTSRLLGRFRLLLGNSLTTVLFLGCIIDHRHLSVSTKVNVFNPCQTLVSHSSGLLVIDDKGVSYLFTLTHDHTSKKVGILFFSRQKVDKPQPIPPVLRECSPPPLSSVNFGQKTINNKINFDLPLAKVGSQIFSAPFYFYFLTFSPACRDIPAVSYLFLRTYIHSKCY